MKKHILILFLLVSNTSVFAQSYNMSNATVSDCNATFFDSNNTPTENYGHNENLVFSICPAGADSIILDFTSFCTELNLDVITFYDGPNTASPTIGLPFSGNSSLPPTIVATSGCLSIGFVSDASVNCTGWEASWQTIINTPDNPIFDPIAAQDCNTNSIVLTLDQDILCNTLNASNFSIFGPSAQTISSITPIACTNNTTNSIQVDFSPGTDQNGTYQIQLDASFTDACNNIWPLSAFGSFMVDGCPIAVEILGDDTICLGDCIDLTANAWAGDGNYNYVWDNGLASNAGPHTICPSTTSTYQVTATDGTNAPAGTASKTVYVIQPVTMPANFSVCQTDPVIDLDASPNTGYWTGPCFGNDTLAGIFHPNWCGTGVKTVTFNYFGCQSTMDITVDPMNFWTSNYLLCPGSTPFNFNTNNPGGTYSGTGITDATLGTFDATVAGPGSHQVTYSNPPCADRTRWITIGTPTIQTDDTLCSNDGLFEPVFNPKGGEWSGTGVTNWYWCRFDASIAGAGTHTLLYSYGDCVDTLRLTVFEVEAGPNILRCVDNAPFNITSATPAGGTWSGTGITDATNGTFDPNTNGGADFNPWVYYNINGCVDSLRVFVRNTVLPINPLPSFCDYDSDFDLNYNNTERTPWSGTWSGIGITNSSANGVFSPAVAGSGTHTLYYEVNNCVDSTEISVFQNANLQDTSICIDHSIFDIPSAIPGGTWSGNGIVNPVNGSFLPSNAGVGVHSIEYITPNNCYYYMNITVSAMPVVNISGLPASWCMADTNFIINALPANGNWLGTTNDSIFNPINAGNGNFNMSYSIGTGQCQVSAAASIFIDDTLQVSTYFSDTTICEGDFLRIGASGNGGNELNYNYTWDNGLGNSFENVIQPSTDIIYTITLNDGCSETATATTNISIQPDFELTFETSALVCYEAQGFAELNVLPPGIYTYEWNTEPVDTTTRIDAKAGNSYRVKVRDINGCEKEEYIEIPTYGKLQADFTVSPNDDCVDLLNPEVYIIDQSTGATAGNWSFGDGNSMDYNENNGNITHFYADTGTFDIFLSVTNQGNCSDTKLQTVCVKPRTIVQAPTAFSPNGDGINDVFLLKAIGIGTVEISIYNRWGEKVFETNNIKKGWDGTYKNKVLDTGTFSWQVIVHGLETNRILTEKGSFELIK